MLIIRKLHKLKSCLQPILKFRSSLPLIQTGFQHNLNHVPKRWFYPHCILKNNVQSENDYMFNVIRRPWVDALTDSDNLVHNDEEFSNLLQQNWRSSNASDIVGAFKQVKQFCINNNIPLSDERFNKLVDGLIDHCEKMKYEEILDLLRCLAEYPPCESYSSHNMHDVWSCLDDVCCWKMQNWSVDERLSVADLWYKLNLPKICDYVYHLLDKTASKAHHLTKDQLVRFFFLFNICRKVSVDFNYEYILEKKIEEMNIDEMAVVAIGYFKTKSKFKSSFIAETMINEVIRNSISVHEISLTAILKILRYSCSYKLTSHINRVVDAMYPEIDRLSDVACLHLLLLPASLNIFHQKLMQKGTEKLARDIDKIRLKDIEKLLYVLTMFNFNPKIEPDIFSAAYEQIHSEKRLWETIKHPRILLASLYHLSMRDIYSNHWMDKIFDVEYIQENFGKGARNVPRLVHCLDVSVGIDCPDYQGKRLPPSLLYKAAKWNTCFTPTEKGKGKGSLMDQFHLSTIKTVKRIVQNHKLLFIEHVIPSYPRADIILCKDKTTDSFVEPIGFQKYFFGDVMVPHQDDNLKWYAVVVIGPDQVIKDTSMPLAAYSKKLKQLEKIGYTPVPVIWREFMPLSDPVRDQYISANLR